MAAKQIAVDPTKLKINNSTRPERILLFSGKRKSGKDYITDNLHQRIGSQRSIIIRLSGPIKTHWAKSLNLDINQLLADGEYKEKYRLEMVKWGENMRRKDYGYFCRAAIDMYDAWNKSVWIISDVRRKTDIKWFIENFGDLCKNIHIVCSEEVRQKRGWIFTTGIDDSETECDLDDVNNWDLLLENNNNSDIEAILQQLLGLVS
ncbi:Phosphomevalonate kinase [Camponotus floridanus]|uniref:Phosphomevalonate kinase n=1 Tax=Camponotus floridanus TaxID=104421 RepID=E2APH8_CAMFO|nr:probable phosphomevalonate kinase [Camponotus floridanus]EFN64677.1 Phosphomevalonate kinase [Camponotus floridanus]